SYAIRGLPPTTRGSYTRRFFPRLACPDEPGHPFCKFMAASQSHPTLLHFEIMLDLRCVHRGFRPSPAFPRTAKALANCFAAVLEHGARLDRQSLVPNQNPAPEGVD